MIYSINTICVCGAGTMGSGIAQVAAQAGYKVLVFDIQPAMLEKCKIQIEKGLELLVQKQKISEFDKLNIIINIGYTSNINECIADLCIEAIAEIKEVKISLFNQLAAINNVDCILATNTSSIAVSDISGAIPNPSRVVGMHFFNPAPIMKLVEIVKSSTTSDKVTETLVAITKQMQKTPVVCKDAPGFIVNRVARSYYLEAMKLVENNLATVENVDAIMESTGFKMGPFKLMDLIGLDVNFSVSNIVYNTLNKPARLKPSILQQQKVEQGLLGKKTAKGFYEY